MNGIAWLCIFGMLAALGLAIMVTDVTALLRVLIFVVVCGALGIMAAVYDSGKRNVL